MRNFLSQLEAAFYHITTMEKWQDIQRDGLQAPNRKIFVSRVGRFVTPSLVLLSGPIVITLHPLKQHLQATLLASFLFISCENSSLIFSRL
jgi:hypothetical protein